MPTTNPSNYPSPPIRLFGAASRATKNQLQTNFDQLKAQMRHEPITHFKENSPAPTYSAIQSGLATQHNGFALSKLENFLVAERAQGLCSGSYAGDKLHLSVTRTKVPDAFDALSGLLFSDHCPFDKWKVTDMAAVQPGHRVSEGAQITFYVKPDDLQGQHSSRDLSSIRHFIDRLETALIEHNVEPGLKPDSDVSPDHWRFSSYRNEIRSDRRGSPEQTQKLLEESFYRLITEQ